MRAVILAIMVAVGATTMINTTPAQARDLPFCIKGQGYPSSLGSCSFWTYEQCLATASGRMNYCDANPYYQGGPAPEEPRHRRHRSHRNYY